ncbi:hypothetical protein M405DRAFT_135145 [Rhizopogon salebrosus TDB-379]|nr:hypothetical protein M405DRAFT_135145 [Rhizopogon salebrosus TDB-379]
MVVSGSADGRLRLWNVKDGSVVGNPWEGYRVLVVCLDWSPNAREVASGSEDGTIRRWNPNTGRQIAPPINTGHMWMYAVKYSPRGDTFASCGGDDNSIKVWSKDGKLLIEIKGHHSAVFSLCWSKNGTYIFSASGDRTIRKWHSIDGKELVVLRGHTNPVNSICFTSDERHLVSASSDCSVRIWDLETNEQVGDPLLHDDELFALAIPSNGQYVASAGLDKKVYVWSLEAALNLTGNQVRVRAYDAQSDGKLKGHGSSSKDIFDGSPLPKRRANNEGLTYYGNEFWCDDAKNTELKHAAFHGAQRYDEPIESFLSKVDQTPDMQIRRMRQQFASPSDAEVAIRRVIHAHMENLPPRLFDTTTGLLHDRDAQIDAFKTSTQYKELLSLTIKHADRRSERIKEAILTYFCYAMLSHRWEGREPLLHDIQDKVVYQLEPVGGVHKLQSFCKVARDGGYRWAWSDTCCIDKSNNVELQESVNTMFVWYRHSALTIIYLSDVSCSSKSGALAESAWNERGWTVQEFLAPNVVIFYQKDWSIYLDDRTPNHKESVTIIQELSYATGIDPRALVNFQPGMRGAREKLRWASRRVTTWQEDIAYSLFGIFGVHLPVIYGEKKQNALGRLLQEIIARSGDITALDWVGKSSEFNSCLPADITSYEVAPCTLPSPSEDEIQTAVSSLLNTTTVELALNLYTVLCEMRTPRFAQCRLSLSCIVFPVTAVRRRHDKNYATYFAYEVKAEGLNDLVISTEDKLVQFSQTRPARQAFLLVRPWDHSLLDLADFANDTQSVDDCTLPGSPSPDSLAGLPIGCDSEAHLRALRLIVHLGQPFGAFLLAQQWAGEYKRIASDHDIIAQVKDVTSVRDMMDVRRLEIL